MCVLSAAARTWPRLGAGGDGGGDEDSVLHARGEGALGIRRSRVVDGATRTHSTDIINLVAPIKK